MSVRVFIRNDDVWTLDKEFLFLFDAALERSIPVVHAVIPEKMDKKLVEFLHRAKEQAPHLLDIVQHGWEHLNHSPDNRTKYEFGPARSLRQQRQDIQQGLKAMRLAFEDCFTPAFVPPYHGYDERTIKILDEEGFDIFSAGTPKKELKNNFIEYPAKISFTRYDQGKSHPVHTAKQLIEMLVKNIRRDPLTGIVTHHADFKTAASRKELTKFLDMIAALRTKRKWEVILFSDFERK